MEVGSWVLVAGLLVLLWLSRPRPRQSSPTEMQLLSQLRQVIDSTCQACGVVVDYRLHPSDSYTYTSGNSIHLVLASKGRSFDRNSLVMVLLHEVAHVLSPRSGHGPLFLEIESLLLQAASKLGHCDLGKGIDQNYPCRR